jgi:hypothetical protein
LYPWIAVLAGIIMIARVVAVTFVYSNAVDEPNGRITLGEDYSWLRRYPVVKRIGHSIDRFDLEHPLK